MTDFEMLKIEFFLKDHDFKNITDIVDKAKKKKEYLFTPSKNTKSRFTIYFDYNNLELKMYGGISNINHITTDKILMIMGLSVCTFNELHIYEIEKIVTSCTK